MDYEKHLNVSINKSNLSALSLAQSVEMEKRICEIAEIASVTAEEIIALCNDGYGLYEIVEMLRDAAYTYDVPDNCGALLENRKRVDAYLRTVSGADKGVFAELLSIMLGDRAHQIAEDDFLHLGSGDETLTYVKNKLADEAYDVFSQELADPRVFYSSTFRDAALAVVNEKTRFCILPLEELGGVRLSGIEELIFKHDLKINMITPVFGVDGMADMKYALISKHFFVPDFSPDDDRYIEVKLQADDSSELLEVITAANTLGISVYRVNTLCLDTDEGEGASFTLVLKRSGKTFVDMLFYLAFFSPSHMVVGIYKNLE